MQIANALAFNAAPNTGTVNSAPILARFMTQVSAQATFTDNTAAGSLKLQASDDAPANGTPTNWNDIPNTATAVSGGATTMIPVTNIAFQWVRLVFVSSGGAGTITGRVKLSGIS